jgi:hypothetical protein
MDLNVQAFRLVQQTTEEIHASKSVKTENSRKGGLKGGRNRAAKLSPDRRVEIARKASAARWNKELTA